MFRKHVLSIALAVLYLGPAGTRAEERYYMFVFAAQDAANTVRLSHTFGLFVKTTDTDQPVESHGISWMPGSLAIQPLRQTPVAGVNLSIENSIEWAKANGARVTVWGPFRIKKALYDLAVLHEGRLNNTITGHIILDRNYRAKGASNCIHALSDLDTTRPALDTGTAHGNDASEMVVEHFRPYIIPAQEPAQRLLERLKLSPGELRFATVAAAKAK